MLWTDLSFKLNDLGLLELAKKCHIKGIFVADPAELDQNFLDKAGIKLSDIERLAKLSLLEIGK